MQILCTRENLLYGVQVVQRAVSSKSTLPILSGILLRTQENRLYLSSTDLELGINCSIPAQIIEEGNTVLPAKIFSELVRRLPDTIIELNMTPETRNVTIHYKPSQVTINSMDPEEFPIIPDLDENISMIVKAAVFKSMVKHVAFATATDENRPIFTGVLIVCENDSIKMIATDTHRLAYKSSINTAFTTSTWQAIIPAKALVEVSRLIQDDEESIKIVMTNSQILFRFGDITLLSRLIDGQFPNYKQVIPSSCKTKVRMSTKALASAVDRASLLAREGSNIIKLKIQGNTLVITSSSQDLGKVHEEIDMDIQGEETQIAFNSRYLIDVLKVIESEQIVLELTGALSPGVIRPVEDSNYLYLILPVRTN